MKILAVLVITLTIFCFESCSSKSTGITENKSDSLKPLSTATLKTDSSTPNMARFIVTFYSIGEGTEGDQIKNLESFIISYGQKINKKIAFETSHYGREGEVDYCLKLTELSDQIQLQFIKEAKDVLKSAKWVHFSENTVCRENIRRRN